MCHLLLVGLLAPADLLTSFPTLAGLFAPEADVQWALVQRQDRDVAVGTTFRTTGSGREGQGRTHRYRLVAVSQQYGTLWEELPHGWNGICAFQRLSSGPGLVAGLPLVSGWYEQRAHTLVLTAEQDV
jgi:hypothetical protein